MGKGVWRWGEKEIIYLSLHCHHQNDFCIKMGSDESHFNVSVASDGQSHKTVSTNYNLSEEKGEPKRYRTEVLPLTSLTPYRQAKPAHTPYNHAPCHFMQSHIRKMYACLALTCHLHFWQNDRGLLHATAVTREWNGYRNKSQHRKLTLEKKILQPLLQGFESATFRSRVRRSNH